MAKQRWLPQQDRPSDDTNGGTEERARVQKAGSSYYYAGGERIQLERDPATVGVLLDHAATRALPSKVLSSVRRQGHALRSGIVIVPSSAIPSMVRQGLDAEGALLPVFVHGQARILVLPEVRVESKDPQQVSAIRRFLASEVEAGAIEEQGTRLTFRPRSGRAEDALEIASRVEEQMHPVASQARFVRIVPRS